MELRAARFCWGSSAVHNEQVMLRCARWPCYQHQLHDLDTDCKQCQRGEAGWRTGCRWKKRWKITHCSMSQGLKRHRMAKAEPAVAWGWAVTQNSTDPQWETRRPHRGWAKLAAQQENTSSSSPDCREVTPSGKLDWGCKTIWGVTENCGVGGAADNVLMF